MIFSNLRITKCTDIVQECFKKPQHISLHSGTVLCQSTFSSLTPYSGHLNPAGDTGTSIQQQTFTDYSLASKTNVWTFQVRYIHRSLIVQCCCFPAVKINYTVCAVTLWSGVVWIAVRMVPRICVTLVFSGKLSAHDRLCITDQIALHSSSSLSSSHNHCFSPLLARSETRRAVDPLSDLWSVKTLQENQMLTITLILNNSQNTGLKDKSNGHFSRSALLEK